jgi:hypothetical protein
LHCENENLIKADWLTMWVLEMFHPIYPGMVWYGMGSDFQFWLLFSFYLFSVLSVFHCVFNKLD